MKKHNLPENNLIILSKQTLDTFLDKKNGADLIALYCFYYYTAKWQKTNQPKATINYTAKGLGWGETKTRERKKQLKELGLINDVKDINEITKKVKGWYVKLNYVWKEENHPIDSPQCGNRHRVEKTNPNALSANKKNALSVNKEIAEASSAFSLKEELEKMKNDPKKYIQLIGEYLEEKDIIVEDKAQLQIAIKRHLRAANDLAKFPDKRIGWATKVARKDYPEYTLETLVKILTR